MKTYPLKQMSLEEAMKKQFKLIDCICNEFSGAQFLNMGDLGVVQPNNKPMTTEKVERVLADFFHVEKALFVTGAGTGAMRNALYSMVKTNGTVLVHKAPIYPTTLELLKDKGIKIVEADYHDVNEIEKVLAKETIDCAIIQHTRQQPEDRYDIQNVIHTIKQYKNISILTDENYAVMKVPHIGAEMGADVSAFSAFKLLGPEGIGVIVGKKSLLDEIEHKNYSGGSKVQGWQAMEVLRSLVYVPVMQAIQSNVNQEIILKLKNMKIKEIKDVFLANAQSNVIIVEFENEIAAEVLYEAERLGAAPNPVGAESKYEVIPMFYRVSGTFRNYDPTLVKRMIRINPMRSGADTVINILKTSIERARKCL